MLTTATQQCTGQIEDWIPQVEDLAFRLAAVMTGAVPVTVSVSLVLLVHEFSYIRRAVLGRSSYTNPLISNTGTTRVENSH